MWLVDPLQRSLEIYALDGSTYRLLEVAAGEERGAYVPFDAIVLALEDLWRR